MPEQTVIYDEARRISPISLDKRGELLQASCQYKLFNDGSVVSKFGLKTCREEVEWAATPQNVKDALVVIDSYMQTAMNAKEGLA